MNFFSKIDDLKILSEEACDERECEDGKRATAHVAARQASTRNYGRGPLRGATLKVK